MGGTSPGITDGFIGAVGNTPLIRLRSLSDQTGCEILGKAEFMNPGGSVKDRAALGILREAEASGALRPGGTVVEGTAGNTGIGLAHLCNARGYRCLILIPETQSAEKIELLRCLGAEVRTVPAVPYRDPNNYVRLSGRVAEEIPGAVWANQFDNLANRRAHASSTGPEIWEQCGGRVDAWVSATGTGGTYAGVAMYLKDQDPSVRCVLADPCGSALYSWASGDGLRAEGNSITEGIGNSRITANLDGAPIDDAVRIDDQEALRTIYGLLWQEGLFMGGSVGINVAAAVETARRLGPGHRIVTVLCDGGDRYRSRLYNREWLTSRGLIQPQRPAPAARP
jgi:cysteine synthase A